MQGKTKIVAEDGQQQLFITREFGLPLALLFKAYQDPAIVEQWMGTKVMKLENKKHGSYHFVTTDPKGNKHGFNGTIHEFVVNQKITRTFEMEGKDFGVQLEFLEFEALTAETSKLTMHVLYRSVEVRYKILQLPFAQGINMAHNRIEHILSQPKNTN
ncbi:MAG: SRPBCC domain-containing protein [Cyclobacteriaceae bacterium]